MALLPEGFEIEKKGLTMPEGFQVETLKEDFIGASVIEPARAVISSFNTAVEGGIAGIFQALNPFAEEGAGAKTVREFQEGAFTPETAAGKEGLANLGAFVQAGIDIVNFPISGLAGLTELISGQGIDQAVQTVKSVQEKGVSSTAGNRVFEETGSPLAATIAEVVPSAAVELLALKGVGQAAKQTQRAAETIKTAVAPSVGKALEATKDVSQALFNFQSPTKQKIAQLIQEGTGDVATARFKLAEGETFKPKTKLGQFISSGAPKVVTDSAAVEAIKQGFDKGVIAAIKGSSKADKSNMEIMVNIAKRSKENKRFGVLNRPSDRVGDILMGRLDIVRKANRAAGSEIDKVARSLKGSPVDVTEIGEQFTKTLLEMDVKITPDLKLDFSGSIIEGVTGAEKVITNVFNRMQRKQVPDANEVHQLKRFIDEQITFGKNAEGLAGSAERALKDLRFSIKEKLNNEFPAYGEANLVYSETIRALDAFQDVAGRKMDLTGPNADKATGTLMRRLMGNAQSRIRLLDSIREIEAVAKKHGGFGGPLKIKGKVAKGLENDLITQVLFADELDAVFGPAARTSLQGEFDRVIKKSFEAAARRGAVDIGIEVVSKVVKKSRRINEANAFKSIKELLKQGK